MIDEKWVIFGAILGAFGALSYLIAVLKGQAKPNKISWFIWSLAPLIAFAAEIKQGVGLPSLMTFMVGFMPFVVFMVSLFVKSAYWEIKTLDYVCGGLAILGLILWQVTSVGNLAILFSIIADGLGSVPTLIKSWNEPESESPTVFLFGIVQAGITLLALQTWNFEHYAFPLYIVIVDILLFSFIKFKPGKRFV